MWAPEILLVALISIPLEHIGATFSFTPLFHPVSSNSVFTLRGSYSNCWKRGWSSGRTSGHGLYVSRLAVPSEILMFVLTSPARPKFVSHFALIWTRTFTDAPCLSVKLCAFCAGTRDPGQSLFLYDRSKASDTFLPAGRRSFSCTKLESVGRCGSKINGPAGGSIVWQAHSAWWTWTMFSKPWSGRFVRVSSWSD